MKLTKNWQVWVGMFIFFALFLIGAQNATAVSFDYYSHIENPPVARHSVPSAQIDEDLKGELGEVHLRLPIELAQKGLDTLHASISVRGLESKPIEFVIEKYELTSDKGIVNLYPQNFDREIKKGVLTAEQAVNKLHSSTYETNYTGKYRDEGPNFTNFTFRVKNYSKPFSRLTLNVRVKIMYQGQEEIIEDSIPLYRGRYTFGFLEYLRGQFYE